MPSNAFAQLSSTPSAIANGRYFSNISGVFTIRCEPIALHTREELAEPQDLFELARTRRRA